MLTTSSDYIYNHGVNDMYSIEDHLFHIIGTVRQKVLKSLGVFKIECKSKKGKCLIEVQSRVLIKLLD